MSELALVAGSAGTAALASLLGALAATRRRPSSMFSSVALGLAGGALVGAVSFEMLPSATDLAGVPWAGAGFLAGLLAMYGFEIAVMRGRVAGEESEQREETARHHRRHRPWGDTVTVLAGGTAAEELIEGVSIGVGGLLDPRLALIVAASITLDNATEGLAIGALATERPEGGGPMRAIRWSGTIGFALFASAVASWVFLRTLPGPALGVLIAAAAGGMLYLAVTDLIPEAELRHYQHSSAMAVAAGFLAIFVLSRTG